MFFRLKLAATAVILAAFVCGPSAHAQGRGARVGSAAGRARPVGRGFEGLRFQGSGRQVLYPGWGWSDYPGSYYPDAEGVNYPPPEPTVAENQPVPVPPAPPIEPLVMELRDGQWVRIANGSQLPLAPAPPLSEAGPAQPAAAPAPLPAAIIVFRDGHSEEISKYMIQGGVLYVSADYWNTGAWVRKIPISDLDVPATLSLNQQRGSKFKLASGPGEVMLRF
jgi:hypothetical protein